MDVRIENRLIRVGDETRALISGEMHYWRLQPDHWLTILQRIRELGLNVISTYIPWEYHEVAVGEFDFKGDTTPHRNLTRFLELVAEEGFWLLFRPGPYIYTEWVNMGVPDRVAGLHRLHSTFMQEARVWMEAVVQVAEPYLATNGGPIVLFQADNEPEAWVRFYADQLGLAREPGPFQDFLRQLYQNDISKLNSTWQTHHTSFEQVRATLLPVIVEPAHINRYLDYRRFIYWYSTEIGQWAAETYRELGVSVPIYLNFYPIMSLQNWRDLEAQGVMAGPDYYMNNEFRRDSWEHQEFLHLLRYTRTYSNLPCIPEFQAGSWHGWHYISGSLTAKHHHMAALSALLAGVAGWNWYMLVNRDNWYMSPINEWGRTRPELFEAFKRVITLYREIDPPSLEKLTDTALALEILDRSSEIGGFSDPVLTALYQADVDYECYDLATGQLVRRLLFYSGGRWLAETAQQRLINYVEAGGHVVFFDKLPVLDDGLRPMNRLGLVEPNGIAGPGNLTITLGDTQVDVSTPVFFNFDEVPGEAITAQKRLDDGYEAEENKIHFHLQVGYDYVVGYRQPHGKGSITVLGMTPSPELILALHNWLDVPLYSHSLAPHISTALFRSDDCFYLIAINNGDENQHTVIYLHPGLFDSRDYTVRDLITKTSYATNLAQEGHIRVQLPGKDGTIIEIR